MEWRLMYEFFTASRIAPRALHRVAGSSTLSSPRRGLLHVLFAASRVPRLCLRRVAVAASQPETVAASQLGKDFILAASRFQLRRSFGGWIYSAASQHREMGFPSLRRSPTASQYRDFHSRCPSLNAGFGENPCLAAGQMFFLKSIRPVDRSCRRLVRGFERGLCSWVCAGPSEVGLLAPRRGVGFATSWLLWALRVQTQEPPKPLSAISRASHRMKVLGPLMIPWNH